MTTLHWNNAPASDFKALQSHFNRMLEPFGRLKNDQEPAAGNFTPAVDVAESRLA